jgi:hypothetical protein
MVDLGPMAGTHRPRSFRCGGRSDLSRLGGRRPTPGTTASRRRIGRVVVQVSSDRCSPAVSEACSVLRVWVLARACDVAVARRMRGVCQRRWRVSSVRLRSFREVRGCVL